MRAVCVLDSSVLCEVLELPGSSARRVKVLADLKAKIERSETLLVSMTSILETGNLVSRIPDGSSRRAAAERFVQFVERALAGATPFTPTPLVEIEQLGLWLSEFVDWVTHVGKRPSGFGDLTIVKEWERQCRLNPGRRVYIWSLDEHLSGYDRKAARFSRD